jgi:hypothetical protein
VKVLYIASVIWALIFLGVFWLHAGEEFPGIGGDLPARGRVSSSILTRFSPTDDLIISLSRISSGEHNVF